MKKKYIIVSIIMIIFIAIVGSLWGIPVQSQIEESGCEASYQKYLFPRDLCQYITNGHCATTKLNKKNAEMEIAHCLCDKYMADKNVEIKNQIMQMCELVIPSCVSSMERIKTDYCNEAGLNSLECAEHFNQINTPDIDFICQNIKQIFYTSNIR